jgi:hypothetical protein
MKALIVLLIVLTTGMAWAFTWEGELDPNEFDNWDLISVMPNPGGTSWVLVKNPDKSAPIDTVALLVDLNTNLLGYRYFKNGEPFGYFFDMDQEKYVRHNYTADQRKTCMQCHSETLLTRTSI